MEARETGNPALPKYAEIGRRFAMKKGWRRSWLAAAMKKGLDGPDARCHLVDVLRCWELELGLPRLSAYGIGTGDLPRIVAASRGSSMKTNPVVLTDLELTQILSARL